MNEVYRDFWSRDPQQIIDSLNADLQLSLSRFDSNTLIGNMVNDRMAAAGQSERVAVTMPEGFSFDAENNLFVYTAPVVVEPEPVVEPGGTAPEPVLADPVVVSEEPVVEPTPDLSEPTE
jgi:hypothetical protein